MDMKRRLGPQGGYTIIEVIIFLTVSSALMASAMFMFQGRIPRTQFSGGVNEFDIKVQDTINDVINGYYPTQQGSASCQGGGEREQGTNEDCIFLGRVLQFGPGIDGCSSSTPNDEDCGQVMIYTAYGSRLFNARPAVRLDETNPVLATAGGAAPTKIGLGYGIHITKAYYLDTAGNRVPASGVAFLQSFGSLVDASDKAQGSQRVTSIALQGVIGEPAPNDFAASAAGVGGRINNGVTPPGGIVVCMKSGSNQFASLTIGSNGSALTTKTEVLSQSSWGTQCA
jgi:hypothetical protein